MSETPETITPEPCRAVGQLVDAAGKRRAWLRCDLPAGHDAPRVRPASARYGLPELIEPGTPHRALFEWADDEVQRDDWPEAYDPDEPVDVDVPELTDEQVDELMLAEIAESRRIDAEVEGVAIDDLLDDLAAVAESRRIDAEVDALREAAAWPDE